MRRFSESERSPSVGRLELSRWGVSMNTGDWPKAKKMKKSASELSNTSFAVAPDLALGHERADFLAPKPRARTTTAQPVPGILDLSAEEKERFQRLVSSCAQITTHFELFLLVQGQLQFFLPQDMLIAARGDFRSQDPQVDVISILPGVRTDRLCISIVPLAKRLHKIWMDGGSQAMSLNESVPELQDCTNDASALPWELRDMRLTFVHGVRNKRDGHDSLYFALRRRPVAINDDDTRRRFLEDVVIHKLDVAYRKVAALGAANEASKEHTSSMHLSVREEEITYWVCQGKSNAQIARTLGTSVNTVKDHVHRIFDKLEALNRTQAAARYTGIGATAQSSLV